MSSKAIEFVASMQNTISDNVRLLGIFQSLASPVGYGIKMHYSGIFEVNKNGDKEYFLANAFTPASTAKISEEQMLDYLERIKNQKLSSDPDAFEPVPTDLWLSKESAKAMQIELNNPFSNLAFLASKDGSFNGVEFKEGDVVHYSAHQSIGKFDFDLVSHFRVFDNSLSHLYIQSKLLLKR